MADTWYKTQYFSKLIRNAIWNSTDAQGIADRAEIAAAVLEMRLYNDDIDSASSDASLLTEVQTDGVNGYSRLTAAEISAGFALATASDGGVQIQNANLEFGQVTTAPWANINSVAIVDTTPTPDRVWLYANLATTMVPVVGSTVLYPSGAISISEGPIET